MNSTTQGDGDGECLWEENEWAGISAVAANWRAGRLAVCPAGRINPAIHLYRYSASTGMFFIRRSIYTYIVAHGIDPPECGQRGEAMQPKVNGGFDTSTRTMLQSKK